MLLYQYIDRGELEGKSGLVAMGVLLFLLIIQCHYTHADSARSMQAAQAAYRFHAYYKRLLRHKFML